MAKLRIFKLAENDLDGYKQLWTDFGVREFPYSFASAEELGEIGGAGRYLVIQSDTYAAPREVSVVAETRYVDAEEAEAA